MDVTAVFETWHFGDGNYPPLRKGMVVNLSFELEPRHITPLSTGGQSYFRHVGNANYEFVGAVIYEYKQPFDLDRLVVLECAGFRFYVTGSEAHNIGAGQTVQGAGALLLDHYLWVEFLHQYPDPPDLFYNLRVEGIWKHRIPVEYVSRTENATSYPTRLDRPESPPAEVEEMTDDGQIGYYLVEFSDSGLDPTVNDRTFLG